MGLLLGPHKDVIGLNFRNVALINELNPIDRMRNVNSKMLTKSLAERFGIPTPNLLASAETWKACKTICAGFDPSRGGVLKPSNGAKGSGVEVVLSGHSSEGWTLANGHHRSTDDLVFHASNIVSGMFNATGSRDTAMVEERVIVDDIFREITFKGVPDIRVIVLKGVPVAAMLRLPTSQSNGKANLHRGGVGVGINLNTGQTISAMIGSKQILAHPDTKAPLIGFSLPYWNDILLMSAQCYELTGLGYFGADIVLDESKGPLLLELNARPGLSIQFALNRGLKPKLEPFLAESYRSGDVHMRVESGKRLWT